MTIHSVFLLLFHQLLRKITHQFLIMIRMRRMLGLRLYLLTLGLPMLGLTFHSPPRDHCTLARGLTLGTLGLSLLLLLWTLGMVLFTHLVSRLSSEQCSTRVGWLVADGPNTRHRWRLPVARSSTQARTAWGSGLLRLHLWYSRVSGSNPTSRRHDHHGLGPARGSQGCRSLREDLTRSRVARQHAQAGV